MIKDCNNTNLNSISNVVIEFLNRIIGINLDKECIECVHWNLLPE